MRSLTALVCITLALGSSPACRGVRAPRVSTPRSVRLLGASDGALRGAIRHGQSVFTGRAGRDYAIEVTNDTSREVGFSIVLDGLDAMTGEPVDSPDSCERLGMWTLGADGRATVRGFSVSETRVATYRFAPPAQALAAIAKGGHPKAIGTIAVCFFSLKPRAPHEEEGSVAFRAVVESNAPAGVAGELRDEPAAPRGPDVVPDKLLSRVVIAYEDEDGAPLGTAPPPAGIARVAPPPREEPAPPSAPTDDDDMKAPPPREGTKPHKPPKNAPKNPKRPIQKAVPDKDKG